MSSVSTHTQNTNTQMSSPTVITNMSHAYVNQSPTHARLAQEAQARQGRMIHHNGRITAKQEIFQIRQNQPSREAPYAEFWDNSIGWGKAAKVLTILNKSSTVFGDDGHFISEAHFAQMFMKTKVGNEQRYDENDETLLGKFNAGCTDSVINKGDSARSYHNFNGVVKKTVFELSQYKRDNNIRPNIENATEYEAANFVDYMKLLNPEYDLANGGGTLIMVENLRWNNSQRGFDKVVKFAKGLFRPDAFNVEIHMYNWLNDEWPDDRSATQIIKPVDTTFGADVHTKTVNVYVNVNTGEVKHVLNDLSQDETYEFKASYFIDIWVLNAARRAQEKAYFGIVSDQERVGFSVYRAGRNITPTPKLWGLSIGQSRARGIRMAIRYGANAFLDEQFGCGTQKTLTDDSWSHFCESMRDLFDNEFNDIQKSEDRLRQMAQKAWVKSYKEKTANVVNLDRDNAVLALNQAEAHFEENFDTREGLIKKRSGKAYTAWKKFTIACRARIEELTPALEEEEIVDVTDEAEEDVVEVEVDDNNGQQEVGGEHVVADEGGVKVEEDLTAVMLTPPTDVVDPQVDQVLSANGLLLPEDDDESDTSSLASSYDMEDDGETAIPDLIGEIQAGVGELIARMKANHPGSSSFLDTYGSSMMLYLEEEKNSYA